jgi:cytochrome b involved in lipid metabolism
MATIYTYEQVAKHNKRDDLYMIIDNKVYDITKFVDEVK